MKRKITYNAWFRWLLQAKFRRCHQWHGVEKATKGHGLPWKTTWLQKKTKTTPSMVFQQRVIRIRIWASVAGNIRLWVEFKDWRSRALSPSQIRQTPSGRGRRSFKNRYWRKVKSRKVSITFSFYFGLKWDRLS